MAGNLEYFIPQHGRAKISLRVPESHSLYICPPACGRRIGLRSLKNGEADYISFLFLRETDVVTGRYIRMITEAAGELLAVLDPAPKAFLIYVNCIDDFLGTDERALLADLRRAFPACRFVICHINPVVADAAIPPGAAMQDRLYSLLDPAAFHDGAKAENSVNLLGNFVLPDRDGELYALLHSWGIDTVRHLPNLETFAEFQRMAGARLNLVLMEMGRYAAQNMEKRLGIPWLDLRVSYALQEVEAGYRLLVAALTGKPGDVGTDSDWRPYKDKALSQIRHCREIVGDTPLVVDSSAASRPFALAKALVEYGFTVACVFITHGKDFDRDERLWIGENSSDTRVIHAGRYDREVWSLPEDSVIIGYDAAFSAGREHFVDLQRDETLFGFHGIGRLMEMIKAAFTAQQG